VDPLPLSCTCKGSNVTVIKYPHDMQFRSTSVVATMEEELEVAVPTKYPRICTQRDSWIAAVLAPTYTANMAGSSLGSADVSCGLLIRPTSWPSASAVAKRTYSSKHKQ
jgi:hypothetical protein